VIGCESVPRAARVASAGSSGLEITLFLGDFLVHVGPILSKFESSLGPKTGTGDQVAYLRRHGRELSAELLELESFTE